MNITKQVEKLDKSNVKLTVTINKEDVATGYNTLLAKTAKDIQLPGFRKGKIPVSILERKYGDDLRQQNIADMIDKSLNEIFAADDAKDIRPLAYSTPQLDKIPEVKAGEDVCFSVTYDVFPTVRVSDYDVTIKVPQAEIVDKDIEEQIKTLQERNSTVMAVKEGEKVAKDNIVTVNFHEVEDGKEVTGTQRQDFTFTVGSGDNIYKIDDDIIGMELNEEKSVTKTYSQDDNNAELAGKTKNLSIKVTAIKTRQLPTLDDDFAQDVNEKYKTMQDLRDDVKRSLIVEKDTKIAEIKSAQLLEQLVAKNDFVLPESMIKAELESRYRMMAQQLGVTTEQIDKMVTTSGKTKDAMLEEWRADAQKRLKARVVVETLLKEYNISITPEEVEAEYATIAKGADTTVEEVKKHYEDPRAKEYLIDDIKEKKLYNILYDKVKVVEGDKTSFEDLYKSA